MRYASAYQNSATMLRGPRGRNRSVLTSRSKPMLPQQNSTAKVPAVPDLIDHSDTAHIVYHVVPVSRLAG